MKRITFYILGTLALATGCIPDDRGNNLPDDSFGLTATSSLIQASIHSGSYTLGIAKNGVGQKAANATISLDAQEARQALDEYNSANNTNFKALPANSFTLDHTQLSYETKDVVQEITITWDALELAQIIGNSQDYVLPVCVKSSDLKVNSDHQVVFLRLLRSTLSVSQKSITRVVDRKKVSPDPEGNPPELQETVILDLKMDRGIKNVGLNYPVVIDNSLIEAYNLEHEEQYVAAPEGLVNILTDTASIPEGGESATYRIQIDKSVLMDGDELPPFPNYLVPVTLNTNGLRASFKGEPFDAKGLAYDNMVTYVAVTYLEIKPGLSVNREWGKYSTSSEAWSSFIDGFTAGADRNVTLDKDYIYIAETNTTKNIWAISLTDPGNYKKLPVGTVASEGTFYVSCPRVIKNNDSAINGGKDVLVVSNMNTGDFKLYVYADGIDADPKVLNMTTWASRRLGDTFTWWGSYQEGMLFFKDFNSAQGTVTFKLFGKTSGSLYLLSRIVAPPVTGAGAYFPYPDNISAGVSSVRGGTTSWLTTSSKDMWTLEGADNNPTLVELSGYFTDTAYRFFDLGDKRYVAYTRQVSPSDGRLFILEGSQEQTWADIILERKVVYQAVIQNDTEQENVDETPSPMSSGNSGMDLDICMISSTEAYIAVVKQNVGLSLFRLTMND